MKKDLLLKLAKKLEGENFNFLWDVEGIREYLVVILHSIKAKLIEGWQDEDRIYTPAEQQLDMRIDGGIMRG